MGAKNEGTEGCTAVGAGATKPPADLPATSPPDFLARLVESVSDVPALSDLFRLSVLVEAVCLLAAGRTGKAELLTHSAAGRHVVNALLGDDEHAGLPPALLTVYRVHASGPVALCAQGRALEGQCFMSDRRRALVELGLPLLRGFKINEIEGGASLAVVRADAWRAFGLGTPVSESPKAGPSFDPRIVQPAGTKWNAERPAKGWSAAQCKAVDQMHDNGMTNAEVGAVVGKSRQAVSEKFGSDAKREASKPPRG